jgi:hypothetical protein
MPVSPGRRAAPARTKQVNFRLPVPIYQRLNAAARALGVAQSRLVADSLQVFFDGLPAKDQQLVESILARKQK